MLNFCQRSLLWWIQAWLILKAEEFVAAIFLVNKTIPGKQKARKGNNYVHRKCIRQKSERLQKEKKILQKMQSFNKLIIKKDLDSIILVPHCHQMHASQKAVSTPDIYLIFKSSMPALHKSSTTDLGSTSGHNIM